MAGVGQRHAQNVRAGRVDGERGKGIGRGMPHRRSARRRTCAPPVTHLRPGNEAPAVPTVRPRPAARTRAVPHCAPMRLRQRGGRIRRRSARCVDRAARLGAAGGTGGGRGGSAPEHRSAEAVRGAGARRSVRAIDVKAQAARRGRVGRVWHWESPTARCVWHWESPTASTSSA